MIAAVVNSTSPADGRRNDRTPILAILEILATAAGLSEAHDSRYASDARVGRCRASYEIEFSRRMKQLVGHPEVAVIRIQAPLGSPVGVKMRREAAQRAAGIAQMSETAELSLA
jgi:hypothetical protein